MQLRWRINNQIVLQHQINMSFFSNIKDKFSKSNNKESYLKSFSNSNRDFKNKIKNLFNSTSILDDSFYEKLMITLIESDVNHNTSKKIIDLFKKTVKSKNISLKDDVYDTLFETISNNFSLNNNINVIDQNGTSVILLIGVNGCGKTSTAAKLANLFISNNKTVCLAAGDTFRAGAVEQLRKFSNELHTSFICGKENEDPSSVFVNACRYCKDNNIDYLICDTSGRLQNKTNLMKELEKINRVLGKEIPNAPHETYLVLDSNTGQNGISQAQLFNEVTNISGVILTKTDGTSKGGIVLSINDMFNIPVKYITTGENVEDISLFDFDMFLYRVFGELE